MTRCWTVFNTTRICVTEQHPIPPGHPVRIVGATMHCMDHAHVPVDWDQVDQARLVLEVARRQGAETEPARRPLPAPAQRVTPVRQPLPFHELRKQTRRHPLPFDPRAAQTND